VARAAENILHNRFSDLVAGLGEPVFSDLVARAAETFVGNCFSDLVAGLEEIVFQI